MITKAGYTWNEAGLKGKLINKVLIPGLVTIGLLEPVEFQIIEEELPEPEIDLEPAGLSEQEEKDQQEHMKDIMVLERVTAEWIDRGIIS